MHLSQVFRTFTLVAEQHPEYFQDFNGVRDDVPEAMRRYLSSYVRTDATQPEEPRSDTPVGFS